MPSIINLATAYIVKSIGLGFLLTKSQKKTNPVLEDSVSEAAVWIEKTIFLVCSHSNFSPYCLSQKKSRRLAWLEIHVSVNSYAWPIYHDSIPQTRKKHCPITGWRAFLVCYSGIPLCIKRHGTTPSS